MDIEIKTHYHPKSDNIAGECISDRPYLFYPAKKYKVNMYPITYLRYSLENNKDFFKLFCRGICHEVIHGEIGKAIPRIDCSFWGEEWAVINLTGEFWAAHYLDHYSKEKVTSKLEKVMLFLSDTFFHIKDRYLYNNKKHEGE